MTTTTELEPAASLIKRMGGATAVSRICHVNVSTAFRWKSGSTDMPMSARLLLAEIERRTIA